MDIQQQIIAFAEKYALKEKVLTAVDEVMDAHIKYNNESGIDFLEGHSRTELIYEFGRFEFHVDGNGNCKVVTKIKIYYQKLYGLKVDIPVGYYEEWTDLDGEYLDDFLTFDWSPINLHLSIEHCIEQTCKIAPQRYFDRNAPEYEFGTYLNHVIVLFKGRQYDKTITFIKWFLDYTEKPDNKEVDKEYLMECLELFQRIYHCINNNELIEPAKLAKYGIKERIKKKKRAIAKKS